MPITSKFLRKYNRQVVILTRLTADASGAVMPVEDASGAIIGDDWMITLANGVRFWTMVLSVNANDVTLADALPVLDGPSSKKGAAVYVWGRANVREVSEDSLGRKHYRDYKTTKARPEVEDDMNARDQTETLKERDFDEVLQWVLDGNDPNTFDYLNRDVNKNKAEERITKIFARSRGEDAIALSWWVDSLGMPRWNAITTRLVWDTARKDRVKARAMSLNAISADLNAEEDV